jgi:alkanesulfonate monooxygenase SsuD/methylene tetrahydromethanopterin reductase-like flavin-dependent oxidoreductase (luciferase family)
MPREDYQILLGALEKHCEKAKRDPDEIRKSLAGQLVIDTDPAKLQAKVEVIATARQSTVADIMKRSFVGTPDEIANQMLGLAEQGVDHIIFSLRAPYPHDALRLFAREVIPRIRAAGR